MPEGKEKALIRNCRELKEQIARTGFLPLFRNGIPGCSVEDLVSPSVWWTGDAETDPWEWRMEIVGEHEIAYGKFFRGRAGFIAKEWLPAFANARREGYDFDVLWEDQRAEYRQKRIMDCILSRGETASHQLKRLAGFSKDGEKNFEGTVTALQQKLYLVCSAFRRRKNRYGQEYGWHIAYYARPEELWGESFVTSEYELDPAESYDRIETHILETWPGVTEAGIAFLAGDRP